MKEDEADKRRILQDDFQIQMTRTMDEEVSVVCNLSHGVEEKGIAKGMVIAPKNLMDSTGMSNEQAMTALKIPETERLKYTRPLEQ